MMGTKAYSCGIERGRKGKIKSRSEERTGEAVKRNEKGGKARKRKEGGGEARRSEEKGGKMGIGGRRRR